MAASQQRSRNAIIPILLTERRPDRAVTFRYKDYRRSGADRQQVMTVAADEFIRRFLLHVLPKGFHRIGHHGFLASTTRKDSIAHARTLFAVAPPPEDDTSDEPPDTRPPCPCCGGHMIVIEAFARCSSPARLHLSCRPSGELVS